MYLTLALMKNEEDGTFGAMAVGRDITEAKIAQQELEASEKRYRNILEVRTMRFSLGRPRVFYLCQPFIQRVVGVFGTRTVEAHRARCDARVAKAR